MKHLIFNYFHFSRAERNGALALFLVFAVLFVAPEMTGRWTTPEATDFSEFRAAIKDFPEHQPPVAAAAQPFFFNPNTATLEDFVRLGLSERTAKSVCNYREKGGQFRRAGDFGKIYNLSKADFERLLPFIRLNDEARPVFTARSQDATPAVELSQFDPNTATEAELRRLGLTARMAANILKYRGKGGKFRVREDFKKLYGLSEQDYLRLEPYIFLPVAAKGNEQRPTVYSTGSGARSAVPQSLDVNAATLDEWRSLPGIGEWRAQQIIKFRDALGGFASVAQIAETRGLPDSVFQKIRPSLALSSPVFRPLDLNTADVEALDRHVYISRKQADLIVNYRNQHGPFSSVDELKKIEAFRDDAWLARVRPYLTIR